MERSQFAETSGSRYCGSHRTSKRGSLWILRTEGALYEVQQRSRGRELEVVRVGFASRGGALVAAGCSPGQSI